METFAFLWMTDYPPSTALVSGSGGMMERARKNFPMAVVSPALEANG